MALVVLQALIVLDDIELELGRNPRCTFKGNVFVGQRCRIASLLGNNADGSRVADPLFGGQGKTVAACRLFNCLEIEAIEFWVVTTAMPMPLAWIRLCTFLFATALFCESLIVTIHPPVINGRQQYPLLLQV